MFINTVFLLGAIHGFVLSILLATKKVNKLSNRILSGLMTVFSIDLSMAAILGFGIQMDYPHIIGADYPITLLYAPLLFLYTKTLINGQSRLRPEDWVHFIAFIFLLIYMIPFYAMSGTEKISMLNSQNDLEYGPGFITHFKIGFNLVYLPFIVILIYNYRKQLKNNFSSLEKRTLDWLQGFIFGGVILAIIAAVIHSLDTIYGENPMFANVNLLGLTIYVYSIGYMGLKQSEFFSDFKAHLRYKETQENSEIKSYSRSGLDENTGKELIEKLNKIMDNKKPYLKNDLNLKDLAEIAGISTHNLTEIINSYAGRNFYDFINTYRVEEVKLKIQDSESENFTILALGLESGFNSKSSFNSVFKKHTGMTPSEFKRSLN